MVFSYHNPVSVGFLTILLCFDATTAMVVPTSAPIEFVMGGDVSSSRPLDPVYDQSSCVPGACELCTDTDKETIDECSLTGRIEKSLCQSLSNTESRDDDTPSLAVTVVNGCKRTADEDEFLFVRFQVGCFIIGLFSFYQVRKQKNASASLFDQRKAQKLRSSEMQPTSSVELVETQALMTGTDEEV